MVPPTMGGTPQRSHWSWDNSAQLEKLLGVVLLPSVEAYLRYKTCIYILLSFALPFILLATSMVAAGRQRGLAPAPTTGV